MSNGAQWPLGGWKRLYSTKYEQKMGFLVYCGECTLWQKREGQDIMVRINKEAWRHG